MCSMASIQLLVYGYRGLLGWAKRAEAFDLSILIKIQPDATVFRYLFTAKSLYMFWVSTTPIFRSTKNCDRSPRYRS